jgi:hypothetical protein
MKYNTIGFFGDSFCAEKSNHHSLFYKYTTYIDKLANHYDAKIVNLGHGGTSVWDTYLIQLLPFIKSDTIPDICVFVWTIPGRLFNRKVRRLNHSDTMHPKLHTFNPLKHKIWNAAREYYTHLYDREKEEIEHISFLRYFDDVILSKFPKETKIIHLWTAGCTSGWTTETIRPSVTSYTHTWKHGSEVRPSLLGLSLYDNDISVLQTDHRTNHLDGELKNQMLFDWIKTAIDNTDKCYDYSIQVDKLYDKS